MKKLYSTLLLVLICSCSKEPLQTKKLNFVGILPAGIKSIGQPSYLEITINDIVYYDEVYFVPNAFKTVNGIELPIGTNTVTSINFYNLEGGLMYQGYGYYDLETKHIINAENPKTIFKTAFENEIGIIVTIFPVEKIK